MGPLRALAFKVAVVMIGLTVGPALKAAPNLTTIFPSPIPGNTYSTIPFSGGTNSVRFQQVYDASGFTGFGYQGPFLIKTIQFREDEGHMFGFSSTFPDFQINLSTTTRSVEGLNTTFSANVGPNDTAVIPRGQFSLGMSSIESFGVFIFLPVPFYYDPAQGNLLLDIRNFGGGRTSWGVPPFTGPAYVDAANVVGDAVSSVSSDSVGALTGTASTLGLVTKFLYSPVPEPSTLALFTFALAGAGFVWKQRIRHQGMKTSRCGGI